MYRSYSGTGSGAYGAKSRFLYQVTAVTETEAAPMTTQNWSPAVPDESDPSKNPISFFTRNHWSPQDDGIEVLSQFPTQKHPSRKDVDAYIDSVLYGHTSRNRLPVFSEICWEWWSNLQNRASPFWSNVYNTHSPAVLSEQYILYFLGLPICSRFPPFLLSVNIVLVICTCHSLCLLHSYD